MSLKKIHPFIRSNSVVARAPGRINLIGEHTDYNDGFVLPAAIDRACFTTITPRADDIILLHSIDLNENYQIPLSQIKVSTKMWANYILGVINQFILAGVKLHGFDLHFSGELPLGGGLSSSAAVECSVATALNELFKSQIEKIKLAQMCRYAEHTYTGVKCGIMDQFASLFGKKDFLMKLDCRSLEYEYVPFKFSGIKILLFDTNIKHSLASSEYNIRHKQCFDSVMAISKYYPEVKSLRDATIDMVEEILKPMDQILYQRSKYVVEENLRLQSACEDLKRDNLLSFGEKMFLTHEGLSKLYDVSCSELDFLVEEVRCNSAVFGARMMGGGFGGCTINLVKEDQAQELTEQIKIKYKAVMKRSLTVHDVKIDNGSALVKHISREIMNETH
jgi:galactokinase